MATLSSILAKDILCDFLSLFHELFALSKYLFELFINIKYSISNACAPACPVCLTLCDPMACSPWGSSVHGIFQARILDRVAISFSVVSFPPREHTRICISWLAGGVSLRQASNSTLSLSKGESEITSRKIIFHHKQQQRSILERILTCLVEQE